VDCAARICDALRCAWFQQAGIVVDCEVAADPTGLDRAKITLSLPNGNIDWGNITVCVTAPPTLICPPSIIAECSSPNGTPVTFNVIPQNFCSANVTVTCQPPSGSLFPRGHDHRGVPRRG
jgi:hypothetical protein